MDDPRIREIRAVLDAGCDAFDGCWDCVARHRRIRVILDSAPPAPRVWLPGDTVPAHTSVVNHVGGVWKHHADRVVKTGWAVELQLPDETDLQAAVDRVRADRESTS